MNVITWIIQWIIDFLKKHKPPKPAKRMRWRSTPIGGSMAATVTVSWTPSVTPTVTQQLLTISINGIAQPVVVMPATDTSHSFVAADGDHIDASLVESDGTLSSTPLTGSYDVPTPPPPTPPAPATNMTITSVPV